MVWEVEDVGEEDKNISLTREKGYRPGSLHLGKCKVEPLHNLILW